MEFIRTTLLILLIGISALYWLLKVLSIPGILPVLGYVLLVGTPAGVLFLLNQAFKPKNKP
jgi:hypothetical protein